MANILSNGILFACSACFRSGIAANFPSTSQIMEDKKRKGIYDNYCCKHLQKLRKQGTCDSQKGKYLIKCIFWQLGWDLKPFFPFYSDKMWIWSKICCITFPEATAISVVEHGEDSLNRDVHHLPEKCRADLDLFRKMSPRSSEVYNSNTRLCIAWYKQDPKSKMFHYERLTEKNLGVVLFVVLLTSVKSQTRNPL